MRACWITLLAWGCGPSTHPIDTPGFADADPGRVVLEYVVLHELTHLTEADHGPAFKELMARYPKAERAEGYLMALGRH